MGDRTSGTTGDFIGLILECRMYELLLCTEEILCKVPYSGHSIRSSIMVLGKENKSIPGICTYFCREKLCPPPHYEKYRL